MSLSCGTRRSWRSFKAKICVYMGGSVPLGRWAGLRRKQRRRYWGGGRGWGVSTRGVTGEAGATGEKAEEELHWIWARLERKQRRSYWGGGQSWDEDREVSRVIRQGLVWWGPLRWPQEWQLCSCRDGLCQPDKRHRRKRRFGAQPRQRCSELRGDAWLEGPSV